MKTLTQSDKLAQKSGANNNVFLQKLNLCKAGGSRVYCDSGHAFIDMAYCSMQNILGHNVQSVTDAICQARDSQPQCTGYTNHHALFHTLQDKIRPLLPTGHKTTYVSSHESLAMDMALKLAYLYWHKNNEPQRNTVLSFAHGYHGPSFGSLGLNGSLPGFDDFRSIAPTCEHIPFPHTWLEDPDVERKENFAYDRLEEYLAQNARYVSAMVVEPLVQSTGGMHICRPVFLTNILKLIKSYGILVICDERFTALLRCGPLFASNLLNGSPDILVLGSTLTNGTSPFGVCTTHARLLDSLEPATSDPAFLDQHGFHIHPAAAQATCATIDFINTATMAEHIRRLHAIHSQRLNILLQQPIVERVRFVGSVGAFDFVCERHNLKYQLTSWFQDACARERVLIHCSGQTVYLVPPLCLQPDDLEKIYDSIDKVVASVPLHFVTACS